MPNKNQEREKIINNLMQFFKENGPFFSISMVFLYGSWAKGFPRNDSDIDLALVFSEKMISSDETFSRITEISVTLEKILKKDVNIIEIRQSFDKPMLYYNAIIHGIPIYVQDFESYINLKNEAIFQMEDFSIFGVNWQYEVAKRNLEALKGV